MEKHVISLIGALGIISVLTAIFFLSSCTKKIQDTSIAGDPMAKVFAEANLRLLSDKVSPKDISLPALTGETINLGSLKGKVVFLNFWATWCPPCREEMPSMEALYKRYKDSGFEILAVSSGESHNEVLSFMTTNEFTFTALLDGDGKACSSYGVQAIPTTFLIDRDGMIILRLVGSIDWDAPKVHAAIETLLNS